MNQGFGGFPPKAMTFFRGLKKNNTREWFQPRKQIYDEKVKAPMLDLVTALMRRLAEFAAEHVGDPNKAIYRIYRDTRFSKNKTPYKTHIAAVFPRRNLEKHCGAGYYFSVSPAGIAIRGEVYTPAPRAQRALRHFLAAYHEGFRRSTRARHVRRLLGEVRAERLTRVPSGYAPGHAAADRLPLKQLLL